MGSTRLYGLLVLVFAGVVLSANQVMEKEARGQTGDVRQGFAPPPQPQPPPPPVTGGPATLPQDRVGARKLAAIREYIKTQSWTEVTRALQNLLDEGEDSFQRIEETDGDGKTVVRWASVRDEADRMLGALPPAGREVYRLRNESAAEALFKDARARNDVAALTDLVCRFRYTRAGDQALILLAVQELDRGHADVAALCFRRLLADGHGDRPPALLFRAALAYQAVGDKVEAERLWGEIARRGGGSLRLGGSQVKLDQARAEFERWGKAGELSDWPLFRGNARRESAAAGGEPVLEPRWQRPLTKSEVVRTWRAEAPADLLPPAMPIAVAGRLYYRSFTGLHAIDLASGRDAWHTASPLGLETALSDPGRKVQLDDWQRRHRAENHTFLPFINSTTGTLSSDGRRLFAVEDLPLTPPTVFVQQLLAGQSRPLGPLKDFLYHNRLRALDLGTGNVLWETGGRSARGRPPGPLEDAFFLSAPLPLAGGLFVLVDQKKELRLVCLDPAHGTLRWSQALAVTPESPMLELRRRLCASHLAYGEGVLVCPTGAGLVLAFDPMTRNLLWAHSYRGAASPEEEAATLDPTALPNAWHGAAPLVQDGCLVLAAPDSPAVECLQLRDGKVLWTEKRDVEDLYVGCATDDKVLIVGRTGCRALKLRTGELLWRYETGAPSGLGVLSGKTYYLPLMAGAVLALDLSAPQQSARLECRSGGPPGNLLFHDGELISQATLTLMAYPQVGALQSRLAEQLARTPRDPVARFERGRLRLDRGNIAGAVEDLRVTLEQDSEVKVPAQAALFSALTQWLRRDFAASEHCLVEYRALCRVAIPADASPERRQELRTEERRRLQNYYSLVARGREAQGRPANAFRAYLDLLTITEGGSLLPCPEDPALGLRSDVWAARELAGLWARSSHEGRAALRAAIEEQSRALEGPSLARFADLTAELPDAAGASGRGLRVRFQEAEAETARRSDLLPVLLRLTALEQQVRDPALAARLLLARARLLLRHGQVEDAAACYQRLGVEYGKVVLPDGRSGATHLADAHSDRRLLAAFDPLQLAPKSGHWIPSQVRGHFPVRPGEMPPLPDYLPSDPDTAPSCRRLRFFLELNVGRLTVTGPEGRAGWSVMLPMTGVPGPLVENCMGYRIIGHLAVVHAGPLVVGLDLLDHRVRWTRNLLTDLPLARANNVRNTPAGTASTFEVVVAETERVLQRAGLVGPAFPDTLYLQTPQGLAAVDPATGQPRWQRAEPGPLLQVFGDTTHLCLVDCAAEAMEGLGSVRSFKVLRHADGVAVPVADCREMCAGFKRAVGTGLLLQEGEAKEGLTLRLYDPLTGKDRWRQKFPAESHFLDTPTAPHLFAIAAPDGVVTVVDLRAGREVTRLQLQASHVAELVGGTLLLDAAHFYVVLQMPPNPDAPPANGLNPWFGMGLDSVSINGPLYAFHRSNGRQHWMALVTNQNLLVGRADPSPLFLCATVSKRPGSGPQQMATWLALQAVDKNTGKVTMFPPESAHVPQLDTFHALRVDPGAGTVDLVGVNWIWRHTLSP